MVELVFRALLKELKVFPGGMSINRKCVILSFVQDHVVLCVNKRMVTKQADRRTHFL